MRLLGSPRWKSVLLSGLLAGLLGSCAPQAGALGPLARAGDWLYRLIVGGDFIGEATLLRFYVWHIVGLIVPLLFLIGWHGFRVRRDGGISHLDRPAGEPRAQRIDRSQLVRTETLAFFLTLAVLVVLSTFADAPLGNPPELRIATDEVKAPWIFLWVQELLRVWPPAIAGVLVPLVVVGLLALLPFTDRGETGSAVWFNRSGRIAQLTFIAIAVAIFALTIRAALR